MDNSIRDNTVIGPAHAIEIGRTSATPTEQATRIAALEAALKDTLDYIDDELLVIVIDGRALLRKATP